MGMTIWSCDLHERDQLQVRTPLLSPQAFLQHPEEKSAEENRDYVITRMLEALKTISLLADGEDSDNLEYGVGATTPGKLATSFSEFKVHIHVMQFATNEGDRYQVVNHCRPCHPLFS